MTILPLAAWRLTWRWRLVALLAIGFGHRAAAEEFYRLQPVDGASRLARLESISEAGEAVFVVQDEPGPAKLTGDSMRVALDDLVRWGAPGEIVAGPVVALVDGSLIAQPQRGRTAVIRDDRLLLSHSLFGPLDIPLELVRGVLFVVPSDPQLRDRALADLFEPRGEEDEPGDLLVLTNDDRVFGAVQSLDPTGEKRRCELKTRVGEVSIDTQRIVSLALNPALLAKPPKPSRRVLVGLADGSRIEAAELAASGETATLRPGVMNRDDRTWQVSLAEVVYLQSLTGKARYLSEQPISGYRHVPYLKLPWSYALDRNVLGTQLRAGGRLYAKGIGLHSASRLTFKLDKPYRRFDALLAIDDQTQGRGHVTCRVFVDSEARYASGPISGGAAAVAVSVDVSGGSLLSLIVDFGEAGDVLDRVDWLDARLVE